MGEMLLSHPPAICTGNAPKSSTSFLHRECSQVIHQLPTYGGMLLSHPPAICTGNALKSSIHKLSASPHGRMLLSHPPATCTWGNAPKLSTSFLHMEVIHQLSAHGGMLLSHLLSHGGHPPAPKNGDHPPAPFLHMSWKAPKPWRWWSTQWNAPKSWRSSTTWRNGPKSICTWRNAPKSSTSYLHRECS